MSEKYVYHIEPNQDDSYLEHFDFPDLSKIKLPDIKMPKIDLPKLDIPKIDIPDIGKEVNNIGKNVSNAIDSVNPFSKRKDYEWKKHKWIARKRDKNGKWIYDYGDGFPGEKKNKNLGSTTYDPTDPNSPAYNRKYYEDDPANKVSPISKVAKFLEPFVGLGLALTSPSMQERIEGGKIFVGSMIEHAKDLKHAVRKMGAKIDEKTGLPLKKTQTSKEDDLDSVNPGYNVMDGSSQMNCPCCTVAYDLRRRGYEVIAKEDVNGCNYKRLKELYKNPDIKYVQGDNTDTSNTDAIKKQMTKEPNGSSGYAFVQWGSGGGHVFNYEIENGEPVIYDGQSGKKLPLSDYAERCKEWTYFRTDNIEPNYESMKEFVE